MEKCAAAFGDFYVEQMGGENGETGEGAAGAGGSGEGGKVLLLADCVYAHCLPALEAALLTPDEMEGGLDEWLTLEDPLPRWDEAVAQEHAGTP